jgi:hypothetical protein
MTKTYNQKIDELTQILINEFPDSQGQYVLADELMGLAKRIKRLNLIKLNGERDLTWDEEKKLTEAEMRSRHIVEEILKTRYIPMSDIRGYAFRIILPSGKSNSFSGAGWGLG